MNGFDARVIVITGGAAGIGAACAAALHEHGAVVHVLDRQTPAEPVAGVQAHRADVTDDASVAEAIEAIGAQHGRIDVLVNNAGVSRVGGIEDGDLADWTTLWDVNVLGYVRATRVALPWLRRSASPAIVNVSSCTAASGFRSRAAYSATKGAIEAMTRSVAADLIAEGIVVNAVQPGTVDTPFMAALAERSDDPAERLQDFADRQPTGRMVAPAEVAHAVAYLAHPHSRSTVGSTVVVDGGIAALHLTRA